MQNLKYKALSIAMAVMTAASPVLSSYTAYASDDVADSIVVNDRMETSARNTALKQADMR